MSFLWWALLIKSKKGAGALKDDIVRPIRGLLKIFKKINKGKERATTFGFILSLKNDKREPGRGRSLGIIKTRPLCPTRGHVGKTRREGWYVLAARCAHVARQVWARAALGEGFGQEEFHRGATSHIKIGVLRGESSPREEWKGCSRQG